MKRFAVLFGVFVLSTLIVGCGGGGSNAPGTSGFVTEGVPADGSNLPDEVKEAEAKKQAYTEKQLAKQAAAEAKRAKTAKPAR